MTPTLGLCNGPAHEAGLSIDALAINKGSHLDSFGVTWIIILKIYP